MIDQAISTASLQEILVDHAKRWAVPGAQAVLICEGSVLGACFGVLRNDRRVEVNQTTKFQMGSSVKMLTSALIMAAVDRKFVSLDAPVRTYLSQFRVENEEASRRITIRHLLSHTAGFDGDFFKEFSGRDRAIGDYVDACRDLEQVSPPGAYHSYSNASFVILAHIAEHVFRMPWRRALQRFVLDPLDIEAFIDAPAHEASTEDIARGHLLHDRNNWSPTSLLSSDCLAPAGAGPACSAMDLSKFCLMLLNNGQASAGRYILQPSSIEAMTTRQIEGPSPTFASAWGLGMMLFDWSDSKTLFGHDGAVPGQYTYVRLDRDSKSGLVLMTNGGDTASFARSMFSDVLGAIINAVPLGTPEPSPTKIACLKKYSGRFATRSAELVVNYENDRLSVKTAPSSEGDGNVPELDVELHSIDETKFLAWFPGREEGLIQRFLDLDEQGVPQALNFRGRVFPRRDKADQNE